MAGKTIYTIIGFLGLMLVAAESDNGMVFIATKIIGMAMFLIGTYKAGGFRRQYYGNGRRTED